MPFSSLAKFAVVTRAQSCRELTPSATGPGHSVSSQGVFSVADFDDGLDCTELDGAVPP